MENGQIALVCSAVPLEEKCDGFGIPKIMNGQRCTRSIRDDGSMSMLAKRRGTIQGCMLKVRLMLQYYLIAPIPFAKNSMITGWGKKLSYCIAFSTDGATDVTRRYVRNHAAHGIERTRVPESVLLFIIQEIRRMRREHLLKEDRKKLLIEDEREDRELKSYIIKSLAAEIGKMLPGGSGGDDGAAGKGIRYGGLGSQGRASASEQAKLEEWQSGDRRWREDRGEAGRTHSAQEGSAPSQPPPDLPPPPPPRER